MQEDRASLSSPNVHENRLVMDLLNTRKSQEEQNDDRIGIISDDTEDIRTKHEMKHIYNTENLHCGKLHT